MDAIIPVAVWLLLVLTILFLPVVKCLADTWIIMPLAEAIHMWREWNQRIIDNLWD